MRMPISKLGLAVLVAMGLSLVEAGVRPAQVAEAADWKYHISNEKIYCEGCCPGGNELCCQVDSPCRVYEVL